MMDPILSTLEKVSEPFFGEVVNGSADAAVLACEVGDTKVVVSCIWVEPQLSTNKEAKVYKMDFIVFVF
jgi:hypothetical protein